MLALKMLRGHYNCREQMTIWVEEEKLTDYFSGVLVCPTQEGYNRTAIPIASRGDVYFKLELKG